MSYKDEKVLDIKFSYLKYNLFWIRKLIEVIPKEFIKFVILSNNKRLREFFWEKLGCYSGNFDKKKNIWIHANAIGEVLCSIKLIKLIKERYPDVGIVLSTLNLPAKKKAEEIKEINRVIYLPYDLPIFVRKLFGQIEPSLIIFLEIDLYPNLIKLSKKRGVPCIAVSHRFFTKRLIFNYILPIPKEVFDGIGLFCMQSEEDARELQEFIGRGDDRIKVTGNLKFDQEMGEISDSDILELREELNVPPGYRIIVAGSVHAEEEEILINAFKHILSHMRKIFLIIAPRHLERANSIQNYATKVGITLIKRTETTHTRNKQINGVILDSFGELAKVYSIGDIIFVGGSLVYLGYYFGGHNILEPASFGKPILFGPYMHNFKALSEMFVREKAGIVVRTQDDISNIVLMLLSKENCEVYKSYCTNAKKIIDGNRGVSEKTMQAIQPYLEYQ